MPTTISELRARLQSPLVWPYERPEKTEFRVIPTDDSEFPELIVTIPDKWPYVKLAPIYDLHIGSLHHDAERAIKDLTWLRTEPYILTWDGGDFTENITPDKAKMGPQEGTPTEQFLEAKKVLRSLQPKLLFVLAGNHEARTAAAAGLDMKQLLAGESQVVYSRDYVFCTIRWRGNNFRLLAHHGSGAATTPGAQRNAARKDMPWAHFDLYWTGHLHQPMADIAFQIDFDQRTGRAFERSSVVMISPSYLQYFGSYAAAKRLSPGGRGLSVATLQPNGRIEVSLHAHGKRL